MFIGPNGSGKSNLIEAISLMRAGPKGWQKITRKGGRVAEWIWKRERDRIASLAFTFLDSEAHEPIVHEVAFRALAGRFDLVEERIHEEAQPTLIFWWIA